MRLLEFYSCKADHSGDFEMFVFIIFVGNINAEKQRILMTTVNMHMKICWIEGIATSQTSTFMMNML